MVIYDKYGRMTEEYLKYQQETWDSLIEISKEITKKAIEDGVCPIAVRETMKSAVECGNVIASVKARGIDLNAQAFPEKPPRQ